MYELYPLPKNFSSGLKEPADDSRRGAGHCALFIARNRFAVLDKINQQIQIRDLSNTVTKSFKAPGHVNEIFYAGTGSLLMATATSVILFDIQQRRVTAELAVGNVKYIVWSSDMSTVALLSKHSKFEKMGVGVSKDAYHLLIGITIADKNLQQLAQVHETIRIKSGTWDDSGVFIYCTLNHIKYALIQG